MLNLYSPPAPLTASDELHASTPPSHYDVNFCLPAPLELRTSSVLLKPIIPSVHAQPLIEGFKREPGMFDYLPYKHESLDQFLIFLETSRRDPGSLLFVAFDLSLDFEGAEEGEVGEEDPRRMAGLLGYIKGSDETRSIELAHLSILPQFHRTHVTSHACCLLLAYALNPPSSSPTSPSPSSSLADMPGLGLRRAQWFSNALNKPSITCALRLGFVLEAAEMKWERVLPPSKEGLPLPSWALEREVEAGRGVRSGRHSTLLGLDWELWLSGGGRQNAQGLVRREVRRRVFSP